MAASAGSVKLLGRSGRTYVIDIYIPDAVATYLTWNSAGLAGTASRTFGIAPEECTLVDVSTAAAPTAVGFTFLANGASLNGATVRWANYLAANPNRPTVSLPLKMGTQLGGLQF